MPFVQRLPAALLGLVLVPLTATAQGGRQRREPVDPNVPTPIEQALMDQLCRDTHAAAGAEADVYQACLSAQFAILRADFGRDLSKLSAAERRRLDSTCSRIRNDQGRDAYVACLSDQLVSLRARRKGGARPADASPPPATVAAPLPTDGAPSNGALSPPPASPASSRGSARALWAGAAALVTAILAAGVLLVRKTRHAARVCRSCGQKFSEPGDLCPTCRHEAAQTLRHAAAERAVQERAQQDAERRQREQEEQRRQEQARQAEEARQQQEEEHARRQDEARREEERHTEEQARQQRASAAGIGTENAFDPYAILGVPRDAGADAIHAAYAEAKAKYDPANVEFLGSELQDLYRTKGEAVERAFKMLTA